MMYSSWLFTTIGLVVLLLWLLTRIKANLFWVYLWQMKNYHIGRFLAHFSTNSGKKLLFNVPIFAKIILLAGSIFLFCITFFNLDFNLFGLNYEIAVLILSIFLLVYFLEGFYALFSLIRKKAKLPEFTSKVVFLLPIVFLPVIAVTIFLSIIFIERIDQSVTYNTLPVFIFSSLIILLVDLLTPLIVSFIVLILQPITVIMRNRIIKKAILKRKSLENLLTIGITGSYGKSSVKEFLKIILSESFKVISTEKNKNSEMGISEIILNQVNENHEIFICEMGAYNRGGIKLLCEIAKPKIGILTGIGNQHLATFGSQKNIVQAKLELIDSLPEEGLAVLNWDSELIRNNFKSDKNFIKYGLKEKEDIWAEEIKIEKFDLSFTAIFKTGGKIQVKLDLIGEQNIPNLLAAIAIAKRLGMENEEILSGLSKIKQQGLEIIKNQDSVYIANSTYSANTNGVRAHLDYLKLWDSQKIFVMPSLIELGIEAKKSHYEMGLEIGNICDYLIITTSDYFKDLKRGAIKSKMKSENIFLIEDTENQFKKIKEISKAKDIVFLEGRVSNYLIRKLNLK